MNNLSIFLNTKVENSGTLSSIGNAGLAPFRYLFNGATIRIQSRDSDQEINIHHVKSFCDNGSYNNGCRTDSTFNSSPTVASAWVDSFLIRNTSCEIVKAFIQMVQTALAVTLLVPGLFLAVSTKTFAYASSEVRKNHSLVKEHFTSIDRTIGSETNRIGTIEDLKKALFTELENDPKNRRTGILTIYGNRALTIQADPGILIFNPMKLVLDGATIIHGITGAAKHLDTTMDDTGKWETASSTVGNSSFATIHKVNSLETARTDKAPKRKNGKPYHMIYTVR